LHYNYFRDFDPSTGRYVESDPIRFNGGLNTFGYVGGNPLNWFDFLGLAKICNVGFPRDLTLPHTFICEGGDCSGKHASGNPWLSLGEILDDTVYLPDATCNDVPTGKDCDKDIFSQCMLDHISNRGLSGDYYNYMTANCGEWVIDAISRCREKCNK
jgi:hypothetical protein